MAPRDCIIAGLRLRLAESHFTFSGLTPFLVAPDGKPDLEIRAGLLPEIPEETLRCIDTFDFTDADAECRLERYAPGVYLFTMTPRSGKRPVHLLCDVGRRLCITDFRPDTPSALFRFGVWMALNIHAVEVGTAAIHSSTILYRGEGVLFLGESGTGKSTHTRLWRQHIPGCELLNDDSPFIRTATGSPPLVCGSPWSGKTPCYRPLECPIRAIVRLSQGPENHIERLSVLQAYGALQPSFPPSLAHDPRLADGINALLSQLLASVPVYRLSCRPDAAAAQLVCNTLYGDTPCR